MDRRYRERDERTREVTPWALGSSGCMFIPSCCKGTAMEQGPCSKGKAGTQLASCSGLASPTSGQF